MPPPMEEELLLRTRITDNQMEGIPLANELSKTPPGWMMEGLWTKMKIRWNDFDKIVKHSWI
jgi:hypothetical protein